MTRSSRSLPPGDGNGPPPCLALVVDDDLQTGRFVEAALREGGFEVVVRSDVAGALQALEEQAFDLVITDIYLGDSGLGYEIACFATAADPHLPVILLTGRPSMGSVLEGLRGRVVDYVLKPVSAEELQSRARLAVDQVRLRRDNELLRQANQLMACVLPRVIEAKDPGTHGHSERVVHYADRLGEYFGLDEKERAWLRTAALLHDVGKIGVPDEILAKPGPLTSEERLRIQEHPAIGHEILKDLPAPAQIREWVYQHHERWDGRGYPRGLRGEEVALPGRILIVAEVFDALATARSYKEAWPLARVAGFLEHEAGCHFDPAIALPLAERLRGEGAAFLAPPRAELF